MTITFTSSGDDSMSCNWRRKRRAGDDVVEKEGRGGEEPIAAEEGTGKRKQHDRVP